MKWYGFKGFPSHSSHCSGGLFPQHSGVSALKALIAQVTAILTLDASLLAQRSTRFSLVIKTLRVARLQNEIGMSDICFSYVRLRKILAPIKIKSALPPPPPKPPLKRGILWTWVFLQKERIFPGAHKIGAAISGPRIADTNFTDTRIFLIGVPPWSLFSPLGILVFRGTLRPI